MPVWLGERSSRIALLVAGIALAAAVGLMATDYFSAPAAPPPQSDLEPPTEYLPRIALDMDGFGMVSNALPPWSKAAGLDEIRDKWLETTPRLLRSIDRKIADAGRDLKARVIAMLDRACVLNATGRPLEAYRLLGEARSAAEGDRAVAAPLLYTVIYFQGVAAFRHAETENCILCRGESSCILPIARSAVHAKRDGSEWAIRHYGEYLAKFPDDRQVKWLLNLAHATLGDDPARIDPARRLSLDRFVRSEFDIGRFRDVGHLLGVNRFNQSGGAILEDFDGDGRLDLAVTSWDAAEPMALYRNRGDGTFENRTAAAGLTGQLGGLNLVQGDFDNDGRPDIFVVRGAWLANPIRPSLLRNNGDGTFADVTEKAGLLDPGNSNCAAWADYDHDGHLDLFVCCEDQSNRLYRNRGDGTFEEVAERAGLRPTQPMCKGAAWLDYDADGHPDLFVNNLAGSGQLFRNTGNGTFANVTESAGIDGPRGGFSCWAFDYDNDGYPDLFAASYERDVDAIVRGLLGEPATKRSNRLYRNRQGKGFEDATVAAGLDLPFAAMGSNFADFDNDGYLDFYLGTGDPNISTLVPNRMFKNVAGRRFAEITGSSGTGHLQKGHGVACGDWDRDGHVDLFIETGGAVPGDSYHNVMFQNPGGPNRSVTVKLTGVKSNRSAIGARIKVVTSGANPRTIYRHVTSGSSFGANPLEQTVGLGDADRIATLEIFWPTSKTTQVFRDVPADQMIAISEFATEYRATPRKRIPLPKE